MIIGTAQAAAEFLNYKMFIEPEGSSEDSNQSHLRTLVQFFIESELHEHAAYLVDALWDVQPAIKDWPSMTDLLVDSSSKDERESDYACVLTHWWVIQLSFVVVVAAAAGACARTLVCVCVSTRVYVCARVRV